MTKRADLTERKQAKRSPNLSNPEHLRQLLFPMVVGIAATRNELGAFVHRAGLVALEAILRDDAETIAGPKGRHQLSRTHHHWGTARTELPLGGRRVPVETATRKRGIAIMSSAAQFWRKWACGLGCGGERGRASRGRNPALCRDRLQPAGPVQGRRRRRAVRGARFISLVIDDPIAASWGEGTQAPILP